MSFGHSAGFGGGGGAAARPPHEYTPEYVVLEDKTYTTKVAEMQATQADLHSNYDRYWLEYDVELNDTKATQTRILGLDFSRGFQPSPNVNLRVQAFSTTYDYKNWAQISGRQTNFYSMNQTKGVDHVNVTIPYMGPLCNPINVRTAQTFVQRWSGALELAILGDTVGFLRGHTVYTVGSDRWPYAWRDNWPVQVVHHTWLFQSPRPHQPCPNLHLALWSNTELNQMPNREAEARMLGSIRLAGLRQRAELPDNESKKGVQVDSQPGLGWRAKIPKLFGRFGR
ncbi:MAG: hypothetical protein OXR67_13230 [Chloroflexota bacterium]|nr:hypothetical protein [Chloroflexota bacterium]